VDSADDERSEGEDVCLPAKSSPVRLSSPQPPSPPYCLSPSSAASGNEDCAFSSSVNGVQEVQDFWFDAEEDYYQPNPLCKFCRGCICLDCEYCFHRGTVCEHCDRCLKGDVFESDAEPEDSDDEGFISDDNFVDAESGEECDESPEDQVQGFAATLVQWVHNFKVPFNAVTALLKILIPRIPGLPKDARTLMKTPRTTVVRPMLSGTYWHNGLSKCLQRILKGRDVSAAELSVNVDGLPISRSSGSCLWPILCSVFNTVFLVGVYHGEEKPSDSNVLIDEFVTEAKVLVTEGILVDGKPVDVSVEKLICDAPAKAGVMKIPYYNSKLGSCTKCEVTGKHLARGTVNAIF